MVTRLPGVENPGATDNEGETVQAHAALIAAKANKQPIKAAAEPRLLLDPTLLISTMFMSASDIGVRWNPCKNHSTTI